MAKIFCFSGTGNSLYAAKKIAAAIGAAVRNMRVFGEYDDEIIGFVFPTYFWGLPKTVENFLEKIRITDKNAYVFSVTTYGGFSHGVNGSVSALLEKQGVKLSYSAKVKMVENYLPGFNANDSDALWEKSDKRLGDIIGDISNRRENSTAAYTIFNKIAQRAYPANNAGKCAANFTARGCKSCGLCEKICPNGNITLVGGQLKFGDKCELCLACLNVCPVNAIDYGKSTRGKKRYKCRKVSADELIEFNKK